MLGGQATGPMRPINLLGYVRWKPLRTTIEKYAAAPSCTNHTFCHLVIATLYSRRGRSGNLHTLRFLQPYHSTSNSLICLVTLLVWLTVLPWLLLSRFSQTERGLRPYVPLDCSSPYCLLSPL
ncbi:hypothetical protein TNCV_1059331 [Trichonephila clavipes]|nr:hypothetical protein TNCV_1059331 [Trichonephila clavipes]